MSALVWGLFLALVFGLGLRSAATTGVHGVEQFALAGTDQEPAAERVEEPSLADGAWLADPPQRHVDADRCGVEEDWDQDDFARRGTGRRFDCVDPSSGGAGVVDDPFVVENRPRHFAARAPPAT